SETAKIGVERRQVCDLGLRPVCRNLKNCSCSSITRKEVAIIIKGQPYEIPIREIDVIESAKNRPTCSDLEDRESTSGRDIRIVRAVNGHGKQLNGRCRRI